MKRETDKPRDPIPVNVVTYRMLQSDEKELKRMLGRDLIEAQRRGKGRK